MKRKSWVWGSLGVVVLAVAAAFASAPRLASADAPSQAPPAPAPAPAACGTMDNPCPLQKWMRVNMGTPLASGDFDALGKALDHAGGFSPDATWTTWAQFAKQGSTAAAAKDMNGVKASCKSCHDAFKDKYKAQYRARVVN
jgi:hypothetical protein